MESKEMYEILDKIPAQFLVDYVLDNYLDETKEAISEAYP